MFSPRRRSLRKGRASRESQHVDFSCQVCSPQRPFAGLRRSRLLETLITGTPTPAALAQAGRLMAHGRPAAPTGPPTQPAAVQSRPIQPRVPTISYLSPHLGSVAVRIPTPSALPAPKPRTALSFRRPALPRSRARALSIFGAAGSRFRNMPTAPRRKGR
jgi:hypothetical protein